MPKKVSRAIEPDYLILRDEHEKLKTELRKWKKKYNDLETGQQSLKDENEKLEEQKKALNGSRHRTKTDYNELRSRFQELTLENQELERENKTCKKEYKDLESKLTEVEVKNQNFCSKNDQVVLEIQVLRAELKEQKAYSMSGVRVLPSLMIDRELAALVSSLQNINLNSSTTYDVSQHLLHDNSDPDTEPTSPLSRADARRLVQHAGAALVSSRHSIATFNDSHICTTLCQLRCPRHVKQSKNED